MNYYEHHLGDYLRKTHHLTLLEHGVYRMLLDKYYIDEKPLPADFKAVQRLVGARTDEERETVETILREYFELSEDGWHNAKCDEEILKAHGRMETARNNGKRGGRPPKAKQGTETEPESNPAETQRVILGSDLETQTKAHQSPITNHHTPEERKEDAAEAALAIVPPPEPETIEAELYRRGIELFGRTSGGLITRARKALGDTKSLALVIEARAKHNPKQWFAGAVQRAEKPPNDAAMPPGSWVEGERGARTF